MSEATATSLYSTRYDDALAYAARLHAKQKRKGDANEPTIPYIAHLLDVSALVWAHGGTETQAIAALLHDAIEDQFREGLEDDLATRFGVDVHRIVSDCSDGTPGQKRDGSAWCERKQKYLDHLKAVSSESLLVSLCDKLSNARSIVADVKDGRDVMAIFNGGPECTAWYYEQIAEVADQRAVDLAGLARRLPGELKLLADEIRLEAERVIARGTQDPAEAG